MRFLDKIIKELSQGLLTKNRTYIILRITSVFLYAYLSLQSLDDIGRQIFITVLLIDIMLNMLLFFTALRIVKTIDQLAERLLIKTNWTYSINRIAIILIYLYLSLQSLEGLGFIISITIMVTDVVFGAKLVTAALRISKAIDKLAERLLIKTNWVYIILRIASVSLYLYLSFQSLEGLMLIIFVSIMVTDIVLSTLLVITALRIKKSLDLV